MGTRQEAMPAKLHGRMATGVPRWAVWCAYAAALAALPSGRMIDGTHGTGLVVHGWQAVVFAVAYAPLVAWGPLLAIVTVHYYRRRRRAASTIDGAEAQKAAFARH